MNNMYARHKPDVQWKEGDDFPDFNQIRAYQSFNWSAFSLPLWVRFNDEKEYLKDYGIVSFSVRTILLNSTQNSLQTKNPYNLVHQKIPNNYSHCELIETTKLDKAKKRELRLSLKHNAKVICMPKAQLVKSNSIIEHVKMLGHCLITIIPYFKGNE
jgi:hypothetical protein